MNSMLLVLAQETTFSSQSSWWIAIPFSILGLVILGSYLISLKNKNKPTPFQERQQEINHRLDRSEAYQARTIALLERIATSLEKIENKP